MKWRKFLEGYDPGIYRIEVFDTQVCATFKDATLMVYKASKVYPPLCAIDEETIIDEFTDPKTEMFFVVSVLPMRGGRIGYPYDIITDGEKIGYIRNITTSGYCYVKDCMCTLIDEMPSQAITLTTVHRDAIMEMGNRLYEGDQK